MSRISNTIRRCLAAVGCVTGRRKKEGKHASKAKGQDEPPHSSTATTATKASKREWKFQQGAEFPWRLEQVVEEEENWRGTWVLEVKDLQAMDWGTVQAGKQNGHGGKYSRQPTRQLPFPVDGSPYLSTLNGGQDDLMVQLGKR
jgi:hypothetical protein